MNTQLTSHWSSIVEGTSLKFLDHSSLQKLPNTVCPLDKLGLLRVSGSEAIDFLNRLLTCKLEAPNEQLQLGAFCNPKGRIISCFHIFYKDTACYLQMPYELVDITIQRLKLYVLMSKVEIDDASSDLLGVGYIGAPPQQLEHNDTLLQMPGHLPRYCIYASASRMQTIWQHAVAAGYTATTYDAWHYSDIVCQIPKIYRATTEKLTPQMINLDLIGGVSFSKGCYPGQEVIARTHHLGKVKRRCYIYTAESDNIQIGDAVYHSDYDEACGIVVDNHAIAKQALGLTSIRLKVLATPGLYIKNADNHPVSLQIKKETHPPP